MFVLDSSVVQPVAESLYRLRYCGSKQKEERMKDRQQRKERMKERSERREESQTLAQDLTHNYYGRACTP
jgi:hypothetical protein